MVLPFKGMRIRPFFARGITLPDGVWNRQSLPETRTHNSLPISNDNKGVKTQVAPTLDNLGYAAGEHYAFVQNEMRRVYFCVGRTGRSRGH